MKITLFMIFSVLFVSCSPSNKSSSAPATSKNFAVSSEIKSLLAVSYRSAVLSCAVWVQRTNNINDEVNETLTPNATVVFDLKANVIPESQETRVVLDESIHTFTFTIRQVGFVLYDSENGAGMPGHNDKFGVLLKVDDDLSFEDFSGSKGTTEAPILENESPHPLFAGSISDKISIAHRVECQFLTVR